MQAGGDIPHVHKADCQVHRDLAQTDDGVAAQAVRASIRARGIVLSSRGVIRIRFPFYDTILQLPHVAEEDLAGARQENGGRRDSSAKQPESERIGTHGRSRLLWGSLVTTHPRQNASGGRAAELPLRNRSNQ